MNDSGQWGSRPVTGKDWGMSQKTEESILSVLLSQLEEFSCQDVSGNSNGSLNLDCSKRSMSNKLLFDLEATSSLDVGHPKDVNEWPVISRDMTLEEEKRLIRKRRSTFGKRRRMSLWATATHNSSSFMSCQKPLFNFNRSSLSHVPINENLKSLRCPTRRSIDVVQESAQEREQDPARSVGSDRKIVSHVFSYLTESELLLKGSTICTPWSDLAALAHANLMLASVWADDGEKDDNKEKFALHQSVSQSMERRWSEIHQNFPWACFLAEGGFKQVFKVYNVNVGEEEAVSVMDTFCIANMQIVANELAVSALLSSLSLHANMGHLNPIGVQLTTGIQRDLLSLGRSVPHSHHMTRLKKEVTNTFAWSSSMEVTLKNLSNVMKD
jgi:hypothetical protein